MSSTMPMMRLPAVECHIIYYYYPIVNALFWALPCLSLGTKRFGNKVIDIFSNTSSSLYMCKLLVKIYYNTTRDPHGSYDRQAPHWRISWSSILVFKPGSQCYLRISSGTKHQHETADDSCYNCKEWRSLTIILVESLQISFIFARKSRS